MASSASEVDKQVAAQDASPASAVSR